ncbi:SdrD B-like domain-containing protein [Microbacterium sp. AK031]|uniref:SdrD B-like domain-containing protein n=1 Tax=Microbacterium sp. AK031 TaxID=2723076 RepID=UPI00286D972E|nr:SdrD B-like domain-containing protein [Microbacterium sp. AK031]MCS3844610.1 DNA-directed RNA polymerase II subunit RPB1 [Microbacterium sp. AK031]
MSQYVAPRSRARFFTHWLAGILVALLAVGGLSTPAFAAGGQVTVFPVESGSSHNGTPVLTEGGTYKFQLGYGSMDDGAAVAITLPEGITIPDAALVVSAGNTAVDSLAVNEAGQLIVTFKDPFPTDVNQGVLDLSFTVDKVENSEVRDLVWNVDGEATTQRVIVTEPGSTPQTTSTWSNKTVGWVTIPHEVVDGKVVIDPSVLDIELDYTVTVSSKDARDVTLTDTLGANLAFVDGSFAGVKTVRDADDLNPVRTTLDSLPSISGTSFTHTFAAEANSVYAFTYKATIADAAALDAVRVQLQKSYDDVDKINGGGYSASLTNEIDISGRKHSTTTEIRGNVQGQERPGTGTAFGKSVDPSAIALDEQLAAGSTLAEGIDVTYTLSADLTVFADFSDGPFALSRNVVVRDALPVEASWNTDAGFLVVTDQNGDEVILTAAEGITGDIETAIAADEFVHTYVVDGQNLYVNLGRDLTENYTLTAKATIDSLPEWASGDSQYETQYRVTNNAYFVYADGRYESKGAATTITVPKDTTGGVDDPQRFDKSTAGGTITVTAGTSTTIPYTFTIGWDVGDAASSRIIDVVDHAVFDVTEQTLPEIQASITGMYEWNHPLDGDTFDVSLDDDGNLVIAPNGAFPKDAAWGAAAAEPLTGTWTITLELPTHVLQGKQTLEITNNARYEGEGQEVVYTSVSSTKATSFGNEMEVRKRVYDAANDAFTGNLRVETDAEGNLAQSEFVYRVELMPHGTFTNMVEDVVDFLPEGVEFVGFVAPGDIASGQTTGGTSYTVPGSAITAVYDADAETVTVEKGRLTSGETLAVYFKVRLVDFEANVGVTNIIGAVGATITPTNDYPLNLLKRDSTDAAKLITDSDARFSVLADDEQTVVLSDLRVVDGKIVTAEGTTPVVAETGDYWLREDVAPAGYEKTDELTRITVAASGTSDDVVLFNTPGETVEPDRTYAIGDVVWIDANKDGRQDDAEQVLPGVTVELIKGGEVIATTTTDDRGRYMFDELPAGEYEVKFTLTEEQQKIYTFTQQDAGADDAVDSDADPSTGITQTIVLGEDNIHLTHDYEWFDVRASEGIDPTWDAGVIVREPVDPVDPVDPVEPVEPVDPVDPVDATHPGTPGVNELPQTGGALPFGIAGIALLLMLSGTAMFAWRRRAV